MAASVALLAQLPSLAGCSTSDEAVVDDPGGRVVVLVTPAEAPLVRELLRTVPLEGLSVVERDDPAAALEQTRPAAGEFRVAMAGGALCADCYRLEGAQGRYTVRAGGRLGEQYGLTHLLEQMGLRFYHPSRPRVPATLALPDGSDAMGKLFEPEMAVRGLHLHTLHPIEPFFAFWEPGAEHLEQAKSVIDWTVKNRGNYVQWLALEQVSPGKDDEAVGPWREHTRAIVEYAHERGVKVGIGLQLFGTASLQRSYLLLPGAGAADARNRVREQLVGLLDGLPFDKLSLSFGEFSKSDPQLFVEAVDLTRDVLEEVAPGVELVTSVHVGNEAKLRVSYMGEELLYYFLVKFADPRVVPWVHTVMYYDLFEDAGGAYHHDDFSEHRAFLLERMAKGQRIGYHPESAYWVAFDNAVPQYHPLYVRSRWQDLASIREAAKGSGGKLDEHVLFSSGWEWGYWQNDYATLRMNYRLPDTWQAAMDEMLAPLGPELVKATVDLAEAQHEALIVRRVAPYIAGRDFLVDIGADMGIVSQPVRPYFEQVHAMSVPERAAFVASVVEPLEGLRAATAAVHEGVRALRGQGDPFIDETLDGIEIDLHRARFARAAWAAAAADVPDPALLTEVDAALTDAEIVVARRRPAMHWPDASRLVDKGPNATLYQYGYLRDAMALCFWKRERAQLRNALLGEKNSVPGCVLLQPNGEVDDLTGDIGKRKADHIELAVSGDVGFRTKTTLFEQVGLVHDALPDLDAGVIDTSLTLLGKRLRAPIVIAAMTGGTAQAGEINRSLARIAEARGYGLGLGSQRAMHLDAGKGHTYRVRDDAPTALVLGNVGVVQARDMSTGEAQQLVGAVGADALCVHLNPAMEIVQPGGDRDFSRGTETLARLVEGLGSPLVAKETGCGLSRAVARRLVAAGVRHVDVSGAGGTSWVAVETHRAAGGEKELGQAFWDWGIPTALSVALCAREPLETIIATGGVGRGLDVARAIVLGAKAAGIARPVLQALASGGEQAAHLFLDGVEAELRAAMLLVGARDLAALARAPRVLSGDLKSWLEQIGS
jgi:isopentenyl-diphosphate Delta-isomerase